MLSKEWTDHPQAKEYIKLIASQIQEIKNEWALGRMTGSSFDETIQMNSKWIGVIEGLEAAITILKEGGQE